METESSIHLRGRVEERSVRKMSWTADCTNLFELYCFNTSSHDCSIVNVTVLLAVIVSIHDKPNQIAFSMNRLLLSHK